MLETTHSTHIFSMFGGYAPEHYTDETPGNITPSDIDEAVTSLTVSMFREVLRSLRAALSVSSGRLV